MRIYEKGVLAESAVYFYTPSSLAKEVFLHIRCVGRYTCDQNYSVNRKNYDSYLLLYVMRGSGYVCIDGSEKNISEGTLVLMDCYHPHKYGTTTGWDILWAHFSGPLAKDYFDLIHRSRSLIISPLIPCPATRALEKIFRMFHHEHQVSEALINRHLINALTDFLTNDSSNEKPKEQTLDLDDVLSYIAQNLSSPISLEDLAARANLSVYYFCRIFKNETGYSPHQYLMIARVNAAKFFLKTTDLSNKEIASRCGFSNESSFCTVFRRLTGYTPRVFKTKG